MRQRAGPVIGARRSIDEILTLAQRADASRLEISVVGGDDESAPVDKSSEFRTARLAYLHSAGIYAAAGFCHAGISIVLLFSFEAIEFLPLRTLVTFSADAWPVPLTLVLLWGPDRRRQSLTVLAYFAVLAIFCLWAGAFSATPPLVIGGVKLSPYLQPLGLWAITASPSVFLLVFLNRRVRNVGPVVLLFMVISLIGTQFVFFALQTRQGLAWTVELSLRLDRATGNGAVLTFYGLLLVGALLFAFPAWLVVRSIIRRYTLKRTSDQLILLDSLWLVMTLVDCATLIGDHGLIGWSGLAAFGGYKLVLALGLRPLQQAAARRRNAQLLLLRVFGRRRDSEQLFALLSARWRRAGSIQLIAGPDLATTTLELHQFLDFLSGRLRRNFIHNADDLERRIGVLDLGPDPDGRFRVNELFCTANTWQGAVGRLIGRIDVVLTDLRGFSVGNAGCIFELQVLVDTIPIERVMLLIDKTTDQALLGKILLGLSRSMDRASPNATGEAGRLRLLRLDEGPAAGVRKFLRLAEEIMTTTGSRIPARRATPEHIEP